MHVGIGEGEWDEERCVRAGRIVTGVPDLAVRVLSYAPWDTAAWVADTFTAGRVFLIGDAASVMPPTGGMGGNAAIGDAYSLAWKLAMAVRGQAGPGLLASHDPERRSFAEELVEQQYPAMVDRTAPDRPDDTVAAQVDPATFLFGLRYLDGAFTPAGEGGRYEDPDAPNGSPGSRLRLLSVDADPRRYELTLLTASPDWAREAERAAAAAGLEVAVRLVPDPGWARTAGIGAAGAVLVRPDRFVAWRSQQPPGAAGAGARPADRLRRLIGLVHNRPNGTSGRIEPARWDIGPVSVLRRTGRAGLTVWMMRRCTRSSARDPSGLGQFRQPTTDCRSGALPSEGGLVTGHVAHHRNHQHRRLRVAPSGFRVDGTLYQ